MQDKHLLVITGPTGVGKSRLGLYLAEELAGEIVSADSRQVYIGADVGTNKRPLPEEKIFSLEKSEGTWVVNNIPIHGYDLVNPDIPFSVTLFLEFTKQKISSLWEQNKLPIVVGGTGFYISVLLGEAPFSNVPRDPELYRDLGSKSNSELLEILQKKDPKFFEKLPVDARKNTRRLARYVELALKTGLVTNAQKFETFLMDNNVVPVKIGLTSPRLALYQKTDLWVRHIFQNGLVSETQRLLDLGFQDTPILNGIIYQPMVSYLRHQLEYEGAILTAQSQTRNYIKRQLTWFRRDENLVWLDATDENFDDRIKKLIESKLHH